MVEITLGVAQARLKSGEDYIEFELVSDVDVRITASIFSITIDKEYKFHSDEGNLAEDIVIHMNQLLEQAWFEEGVELSPPT